MGDESGGVEGDFGTELSKKVDSSHASRAFESAYVTLKEDELDMGLCRTTLMLLFVALFLAIRIADAAPNYRGDILPIFKSHCLSCHNSESKKSGLDLSSFQTVLAGSSGGAIVKAGLPDSSPLFLAVSHHEDHVAMPPNKTKLPAAQLTAIRDWIAGGLVEVKGGKSLLRDITSSLPGTPVSRPDIPAVPAGLPKVPLARTLRPLPIAAIASSPWADVVAASGHEQILLFGRGSTPITRKGFEPVAAADLIVRRTFDEDVDGGKRIEGKAGRGLWIDGPELVEKSIPADVLLKNKGFTVSAWLKPDEAMQSPTVFGRESFYVMLERTRNGWRVRVASRTANNGILYTGRVGEFVRGDWQHIAVICDGKEWVFYYNGREIVRQPTPENLQGFLPRPESFYIGGDGRNETRRYRGGIDDFRFYSRVLSPSEIRRMIVNVSRSYSHIGTLPFSEGTIHDLRFSRTGELLLASGGRGAESGKVGIYDVTTGRPTTAIGDEDDIVLSADISADQKLVATGTPEKCVKVYSAETGKLLHRIDKHTDWVTTVRFSPDGRLLASADRNGGIHVWEAANAGIVYTLDEHKVKVTALCWRADGRMLASAGEDGKLVLWDMKDGWATRAVTAHAEKPESRYSKRTGVLDVAFTRDGRIVTVGRDHRLSLWQPDGTLHSSANGLKALPLRVQLSPDGTSAFVGDFNGQLTVFDLATLQSRGTIAPSVDSHPE